MARSKKPRHGTLVWRLGDLIVSARETTMRPTNSSGYVPCRSMGHTSLKYRLKAAWMVFTGKADAVIWPHGQ